MGAIAVFNAQQWLSLFPQFVGAVSADQVTQLLLPVALPFVVNDGTGPICDLNTQTAALNFTVAHLAQLLFPPNGQGGTGGAQGNVSGPIASATQGSTSVSFAIPTAANVTESWWIQTVYGKTAYAMLGVYRLARYVPAPRRRFNPWPGQGGATFWGGY